ncbi:unnamed protein product [Brassica rapa subsp. trilocularis]
MIFILHLYSSERPWMSLFQEIEGGLAFVYFKYTKLTNQWKGLMVMHLVIGFYMKSLWSLF